MNSMDDSTCYRLFFTGFSTRKRPGRQALVRGSIFRKAAIESRDSRDLDENHQGLSHGVSPWVFADSHCFHTDHTFAVAVAFGGIAIYYLTTGDHGQRLTVNAGTPSAS